MAVLTTAPGNNILYIEMNEPINAGGIEGLIRKILNSFTTHKGELSIEVKPFAASYDVSIKPNPGDMRRIVGAAGANIKALTSLFASIGFRYGRAINVALEEPTTRAEKGETKYIPNASWQPDELIELLRCICCHAFRAREVVEIATAPGAGEGIKIIIRVAANEHPRRVFEIGNALKTLAGFIAKTNGRALTLDVVADAPVEDEGPQPKTSDGRFAKMEK